LQQQQQQGAGVGRQTVSDPFEFEALELDEVHEHGQQQQQQLSWQAEVGWSPIEANPLAFTPDTAHGACLPAAAAGGAGARHMPFASPISPPPLKPHLLLASPAAVGRRQSIGPGAGGLTPSAAAAGTAGTGRRAGGRAGGVAGTAPRQQLGCMTAPAKAPSSRTFARQRQQLSQQLYDQWNAQVGAGEVLQQMMQPRIGSSSRSTAVCFSGQKAFVLSAISLVAA
jgi:hypothetical protein